MNDNNDLDNENILLDELLNDGLEHSVDNLLPQYKLLVETTNEISNRRENTNKFYLTLITIILGALTFVSTNYQPLLAIIPLMFIIIISISLKKHIKQYKLLNTVKFKLINHLENHLPVYAFTKEWDLLNIMGYSELSNWDEKIPNYLVWLSTIVIFLILFLERLTIFGYVNTILSLLGYS